jgi:hypothetical protein
MVHLLQFCDLHDYTLYWSQENKYTVSLVIIIVQTMSCVTNPENFIFARFRAPPRKMKQIFTVRLKLTFKN